MSIVTQGSKKNKRYLPHEVTTKVGAVKLYRQTGDIGYVVRRYHIKKRCRFTLEDRYSMG